MDIEITGRQMDITPALRDFVQQKVTRVEKYIHREYGVRVILEAHKHRHMAEVIVNVKGTQFAATEEGEEMYASIDGAVTKLEQQLRRHKDKLSHHKGSNSLGQESATVEAAVHED